MLELETELTWADRLRQEGLLQGLHEGQLTTAKASVLAVLQERFGTLSDDVTQRLQATTELAELQRLLLLAVHTDTPEHLWDRP